MLSLRPTLPTPSVTRKPLTRYPLSVSVCVIRPRGRALCVVHTQARHAVENDLYIRIVEESSRCVKLFSGFVNIVVFVTDVFVVGVDFMVYFF